MKYIAKTLAGLEDVLASELHTLGADRIQKLRRAVSFEGDKRLMYRANYELRTALRILQPIHQFRARDENDLYRKANNFPWDRYLSNEHTLAVDATVHSEQFRHSRYIALKLKDAIVDYFRRRTGSRPSVDVERPSVRFNLHISENDCSVSLDCSGRSLHLRGYRTHSVEAPINEVLAAGLLHIAHWEGKRHFLDPMCGSGTLPIEAGLMALNKPPQIDWRSLGFLRWPDFDPALWRSVRWEADKNVQPFTRTILAGDKDRRACVATEQNAHNAGLDGHVKVVRKNIQAWSDPPTPGLMIVNPPYDERLKVEEIQTLYQSIGDTLKQQFAGYTAWVISSSVDGMKSIGLKPKKKRTLYNGPLQVKFHGFELYEGSRKKKG